MNRDIRIRPWDWLMIIGAVLAPMTGFRIWKVGPAEVLCFLWSIKNLNIKSIKLNEFVRFFLLFLLGMFLGTLVCITAAPEELTVNGWATWGFLAFTACRLLSEIRKNHLKYNEKLMDLICGLSVVWYLFLYAYSMTVSRTFLEAPLWYSSRRFSGGGTNPHQVAVLFCSIAFWFSGRILQKKQILWNSICFAVCLFLEIQTGSSTGTASIFLGLFMLIIIVTSLRIKNGTTRAIMITLEAVFGLLMAVIFYRVLYRVLYEWISEDSNGIGRFYIWSSFGQTFLKSPVLGLGPGQHALTMAGTLKEFHNSYLEIYAASGVLGIIAFMILSVKVFKTVARGKLVLLPVLISIYVYSMAGFAIRRLIYWIVFTFVFVIAEQSAATEEARTEQDLLPNG